MNARSVLIGRIGDLTQQLYQARGTIQSSELDKHLRDRVGPRFEQLLSQQLSSAEDLGQQVANGQPLQACWGKFADLDQACTELFDECLDFVQGALARKSGVDDGVCRLADDLLDDLAFWADVKWRRFTLLAKAELYRETADLIRISFPVLSLWDLPVVAHEFGHYVGPELKESPSGTRVYPLQTLLQQADEKGLAFGSPPHTEAWHHLNEHFADLFATYTLGPAFACSFLLSRLNPIDAHGQQSTHPSHVRRVHAIFWLLGKMDQAGGIRKPYRGLIDALKTLWQESLSEIGPLTGLSPAGESMLEVRLADLYDILVRTAPPQLAFQLGDWQHSQAIADALVASHWAPDGVTLDEGSRRAVLNGAWLVRLDQDAPTTWETRDVAKKARELYELVPTRDF